MNGHVVTAALLLGLAGVGATALHAEADTRAALEHVERARAIAGKDVTYPLFLCRPDGSKVVEQALADGRNRMPPTRAFDNLWYLGSSFVGVWVLDTGKGLILFDSGTSTAEARDHIVPELKVLGLDPRTIRYVLVTHGHWDHFGGAKYLQDSFGARIGLSGPDWYLMEREAVGDPARLDRERPRRDLVITDGQKLTLGDTTLTLYVTPGHTPGTISAIIPVRDGKRIHRLSLLGGTAFPPTTAAADRHGGLGGFSKSVERLAELSRAAGADGLINTHIFVDGTNERLVAARNRVAGQPNPFVIGTDRVARHYQVFDECLKAAMARPQKSGGQWSSPLPKDPVS